MHGKAKTTKVDMVWYELNNERSELMNQSMNDRGRYRAARAAKRYNVHNLQSSEYKYKLTNTKL